MYIVPQYKVKVFFAAIFYWNCVKPIDQLGGK